ncbi:MAG: DUF4164 domain-containing protein [Pseudomonadota bacterium]
MTDRQSRPFAHPEAGTNPAADIEAATKRLVAALDALEAAVDRRVEADRGEDELAARIQALGADRSRLANELDNALVQSRALERVNREIAEKLDAAIATIREVIEPESGETP